MDDDVQTLTLADLIAFLRRYLLALAFAGMKFARPMKSATKWLLGR